jgi:hypothetical protein
LCVALDDAGRIVSSKDPAAAATWHVSRSLLNENDTTYDYALTCASTALCVGAADETPPGGSHAFSTVWFASTNPASGAQGWKAGFGITINAAGLSCPSLKLCLGVGLDGPVISRRPTEPTSWTYPDELDGVSLRDISCPSTSLCVAADDAGDVLTTTDPTEFPKAWKTTHVDERQSLDSGLGANAALEALSCPTSRLCVAVDDGGNVLTSTDPTGGARAWKTTKLGIDYPLEQVTCASASLCVAFGQTGDVITLTDPTGGAAAWTITSVDPEAQLTALSCAAAWLCVAGDANGNMLLGTDPRVERGAAVAALAGAIDRSCSKQRIARVLEAHGCVTPFTAPGPGVVTITWLSQNGTKIAYRSAHPMRSRKLAIHVRLTKRGKLLLGAATGRVPIRVDARFTDIRGHRYRTTETITLTS